jgi:hypothetical protein
MSLRWTCALALVAALPLPLAAQDARLAARLESATALQVQALVDSAKQERLPGEPLVQKALEGNAKGADGPRIVGAVRSLLVNLRTARTALGANATEPELVAGVATLRAGGTPDMLATLRRLRPSQSVAIPLGVLTDLVARGAPLPSAWRSVEGLARSGGSDAQFLAIREPAAQRGNPTPPVQPMHPAGVPAAEAPRP